MLLELGTDQEFFHETTTRFLAEHAPVAELRRLRHDAAGFRRDYWQQGAELGWTSFLVAEEHGGGSLSEEGLLDLVLVAYEFGRRAAPGPLVPTNIVAGALSAAGGEPRPVLDRLVGGAGVATWCHPEPAGSSRRPSVTATVDGDTVILDGRVRAVEAAAVAEHLLVTATSGSGVTQVLVAADTAGLTVAPMHSVDLTRRFASVRLDRVRVPRAAVVGEVGGADAQVERQWEFALAMVNAEAVGAMQTAFDLTVEWAFDRYSFGRPLASYQELKHRFADMKTWLEAGHAISDEAAAAAAAGGRGAGELLSAAKAFIGTYGSELLQDCVQIHGGIGVTYEHDLHLFLRRHTLDRVLYGTPADHHQRLADAVDEREGAR